jgi:hypothetical protein
MKKSLYPFLIVTLALGLGVTACSKKSSSSSSSSAPSSKYVDLDVKKFDGALALLRNDLKAVASQDQQGFDFTPKEDAGRDDKDFGFSFYYYPEATSSSSSSSSSSASTEPQEYGLNGTLKSLSFRANGLGTDELSANKLVTSTKITDMSLNPLAGMTEYSELALTNQSPAIYTVNDNADGSYREYFDLSGALMAKKAIEAFVTKSYGVTAWTMDRTSYRTLSDEEKTLADGFFTGGKGPTERLCDEADAHVDWITQLKNNAINYQHTIPLTISENDLGQYKMVLTPSKTEMARYLESRVDESSLSLAVRTVVKNDISHYFNAISTWTFSLTYYFTDTTLSKVFVNADVVADPTNLKASETISYANALPAMTGSTEKLPDIRLCSLHLVGNITPYKGDEAKVVLPDLTNYQLIVLPKKQTNP